MSTYPQDFRGRVETAASYISAGRRTSRTFDNCFEMWDGDAVATALMRRAQKRPGTKLATNLWRYLAREYVETAANRIPPGCSLTQWSQSLIAKHDPQHQEAA